MRSACKLSRGEEGTFVRLPPPLRGRVGERDKGGGNPSVGACLTKANAKANERDASAKSEVAR